MFINQPDLTTPDDHSTHLAYPFSNRSSAMFPNGCIMLPTKMLFVTVSNTTSTSCCNNLASTKYLASSAKGSDGLSCLTAGH